MYKRRLQVITVNVCKLLYIISLLIALVCLITNNFKGFVILQVYAIFVIIVQTVVYHNMKSEPISQEVLSELMIDEIRRYIKTTKKDIVRSINKASAAKAFLHSIEDREEIAEDIRNLKLIIQLQKELCTQSIDSIEAIKRIIDKNIASEDEFERIKVLYDNSIELASRLKDNEQALIESKKRINDKLAD